MTAEAETCNYCGDPLKWVRTVREVLMPLNVKPDPDRGNVIILSSGVGVLNAGQATAARARGVELHVHHAVTCPFAARWNKGGRG